MAVKQLQPKLELTKETAEFVEHIYQQAVRIVVSSVENRRGGVENSIDTMHIYVTGDNVYTGTPIAARCWPISIHAGVSVFTFILPNMGMPMLVEFIDAERRQNDARAVLGERKLQLYPHLILGRNRAGEWTCYTYARSMTGR